MHWYLSLSLPPSFPLIGARRRGVHAQVLQTHQSGDLEVQRVVRERERGRGRGRGRGRRRGGERGRGRERERESARRGSTRQPGDPGITNLTRVPVRITPIVVSWSQSVSSVSSNACSCCSCAHVSERKTGRKGQSEVCSALQWCA